MRIVEKMTADFEEWNIYLQVIFFMRENPVKCTL